MRHRISKHEVLRLMEEQAKDAASNVVWPEVITPHVKREYDSIPGRTWRTKVFSLLFMLRWKEEWIAEAMKVSVSTVERYSRRRKEG